MGIVIGPIRRGDGIAPAVALVDPKFPHNVGAAVRAASCYGVRQVWFSGDHRFLVIPTRHRNHDSRFATETDDVMTVVP